MRACDRARLPFANPNKIRRFFVGSPSGPGASRVRAALNTPMAQPFHIRRAAIYRQRAQELTESARQPRDECDRRHLLDRAATFERAADALAPPPPVRHLADPFKGFFDPPRVQPMSRRYRSRGAASFVHAARDRVDPAEAEQRRRRFQISKHVRQPPRPPPRTSLSTPACGPAQRVGGAEIRRRAAQNVTREMGKSMSDNRWRSRPPWRCRGRAREATRKWQCRGRLPADMARTRLQATGSVCRGQ
jgi:hypothetical protein